MKIGDLVQYDSWFDDPDSSKELVGVILEVDLPPGQIAFAPYKVRWQNYQGERYWFREDELIKL